APDVGTTRAAAAVNARKAEASATVNVRKDKDSGRVNVRAIHPTASAAQPRHAAVRVSVLPMAASAPPNSVHNRNNAPRGPKATVRIATHHGRPPSPTGSIHPRSP